MKVVLRNPTGAHVGKPDSQLIDVLLDLLTHVAREFNGDEKTPGFDGLRHGILWRVEDPTEKTIRPRQVADLPRIRVAEPVQRFVEFARSLAEPSTSLPLKTAYRSQTISLVTPLKPCVNETASTLEAKPQRAGTDAHFGTSINVSLVAVETAALLKGSVRGVTLRQSSS